MRMIIATAMLAASGYYLYADYQDKIQNAPKADVAVAAAPRLNPEPMLGPKQAADLHAAVGSADQTVRWAAMQTLWTLKDPQIMPILEKAMRDETDPEVRVNIVLLLKSSQDPAALRVLALGVQDTDPTVRVASLRIIGEVGDLTAASIVAAACNDSEDGVKLQAMQTLSKLQETRRAKYEELNQQLRNQYERQVKKSQEDAI